MATHVADLVLVLAEHFVKPSRGQGSGAMRGSRCFLWQLPSSTLHGGGGVTLSMTAGFTFIECVFPECEAHALRPCRGPLLESEPRPLLESERCCRRERPKQPMVRD